MLQQLDKDKQRQAVLRQMLCRLTKLDKEAVVHVGLHCDLNSLRFEKQYCNEYCKLIKQQPQA